MLLSKCTLNTGVPRWAGFKMKKEAERSPLLMSSPASSTFSSTVAVLSTIPGTRRGKFPFRVNETASVEEGGRRSVPKH